MNDAKDEQEIQWAGSEEELFVDLVKGQEEQQEEGWAIAETSDEKRKQTPFDDFVEKAKPMHLESLTVHQRCALLIWSVIWKQKKRDKT